MNEKLKPCPFCGGEPYVLDDDTDLHYKSVVCKNCQGMTAYQDESEAIKAWNTRADKQE